MEYWVGNVETAVWGQAWEHWTGRLCGDTPSISKFCKDGVWKREGEDGVRTFVRWCTGRSVTGPIKETGGPTSA